MRAIIVLLFLSLSLLSGCATKSEKQIMAELEMMDGGALRKQPSARDHTVPDPKYRTTAMAQPAAPPINGTLD